MGLVELSVPVTRKQVDGIGLVSPVLSTCNTS
jgi:hypothetical protein